MDNGKIGFELVNLNKSKDSISTLSDKSVKLPRIR